MKAVASFVDDPSGRALRRVDWRFLLGAARCDRVAAAGADSELEAGIALAFGPVTRLHDSDPDAQDLVVLADPSARVVERAYRSLRPGGTCYIEWRRPRLGGRRRTAAVRRAGFRDLETLWAWPPPRRHPPRFWLPVDAPRAIRYFLDHRPRPRTASARATARVARSLWYGARATHLLAPLVVLARKPPVAGAGSLATALRDRWETSGLGVAPAALDVVLLTGGESRLNKVVALAFPTGADAPALALKFARVTEAERGLSREATGLRLVAGHRSTGQVPTLVFADRFGPAMVVAETPLTGEPLITKLSARTQLPIATQMVDVLAGFVRDQAARSAERVVMSALDEFTAAYGDAVGTPVLARVRARLAGLPDLPVVVEHRDCSPWNVLLAPNGEIVLLDWESSEPYGLPILDLVYFVANAAFVVDGTLRSGRERTTYARLLDAGERGTGSLATPVARYCDAVGLDAAVVPTLRALTWMVHARSEHAAGQPAERSTFVALVEEEVSRW